MGKRGLPLSSLCELPPFGGGDCFDVIASRETICHTEEPEGRRSNLRGNRRLPEILRRYLEFIQSHIPCVAPQDDIKSDFYIGGFWNYQARFSRRRYWWGKRRLWSATALRLPVSEGDESK